MGRGLGVDEEIFVAPHGAKWEAISTNVFVIKESYEVKTRVLLFRMNLISKGRRWHRDLRTCSIF